MAQGEQGFLLGWLDSLTHAWLSRVSLVSIPPLRPKGQAGAGRLQHNRDIFVSTMLVLSLAAFFTVYFSKFAARAETLRYISAFAMYRAFDLSITVLRIGVFTIFRGDVKLSEAPVWRVQRILIGVLFNYIELVFWYSLIYFDLATRCSQQFLPDIKNLNEAFNLSFSTMTTVGYGQVAPHSLVSNLVAFAQSLTGILLIANAVGSLVSILTSRTAEVTETHKDETNQLSWIRPVALFLMIYAAIWWLIGQVTCG